MSATPSNETLCPSELATGYRFSTNSAILPLDNHSGGYVFEHAKLLDYIRDHDESVSKQTHADVRSFTASSIEEASKSIQSELEVSASYGCFSATTKVEFGLSTTDYLERYFSQIQQRFVVGSVRLPSPNVPGELAILQSMLKPELLEHLQGPMSPEDARILLEGYGTHFVQSIALGGMLSASATMEKSTHTSAEDLKTSLATAIQTPMASGSVKTTLTIKSSTSSETSTALLLTKCHGGDVTKIKQEDEWRESVKQHPAIISYTLSPLYLLIDRSLPNRAVLETATTKLLEVQDQTVEAKWTTGVWLMNDRGSHARADLNCYGHFEDGWFMLGHSPDSTVLVVKAGPLVKQATGWTRVWNDAGSGNDNDYDCYLPTCDDPQFVALGVVFVLGSRGHALPPAGLPVALVHRSATKVVHLTDEAWSDAGSRANFDLTVLKTPHGTMWPSIATMNPSAVSQPLSLKYMP